MKSDAAPELLKVIDELGWHCETSLADRWPHNASHERFHGVLKEAVRSISVQSGFPSSSWHLMFPYAAMSLAITQLAPVYEWEEDQHGKLRDEFSDKDSCTAWECHHGEPFDGPMEAFGRLCYYNYKWSANQHPAAPNTLPGLFVGWRLENGLKYKGVSYVLEFAEAAATKVFYFFGDEDPPGFDLGRECQDAHGQGQPNQITCYVLMSISSSL